MWKTILLSGSLAAASSGLAVVSCGSAAYWQRPGLATALQEDTTRPAMPGELNLPQDSTFTVRRPDDNRSLYYRNIVGIVFDDTTAGATIRAVISRYEGKIIGGSPHTGSFGAYIVQVPDPGSSFDAFDALLNRIGREPGVDFAYGLTYLTAEGIR